MIILRYTIDKLDQEKSFRVDFIIEICIDNVCEDVPVLTEFLVPIPFCNTNGTYGLPGGSLSGFLEHIASGTSDAAINLVLETLGIKVKKNTS